MVTEKLQAIFNAPGASLLHENTEYGFCIKCMQVKTRNAHLIFTEGLSENLQQVDERNAHLKHIELYLMLPDYWDLSKKNWPVHWLNRIAQVPKKNNTWFGVGDTLPAGNPPAEVDEQLKCSYFILSEPLLLPNELRGDLWKEAPFNMLAVIPVFASEFAYKNQYSSKALLEIFRQKNVNELIDVYRQPVARKKFMGIF